ncbi:hypothetical protein P9847_05570 [Paenibacillus chibensis]|uniref:Integral membrane protein n=1 Tax=Paenibacillus chibensis TaxID=59846 RepID=A0ABU6PPG4_9BACL|nr:hypothetical protein [Paenibacillus chibensis]
MSIIVSGIIFSFLTSIVILFQIALALGAPWGHFAMGGKYPGKFPVSMRVLAVFQAFVLVFLGLIVLSRSELALNQWYEFSHSAIWFVVAFSVLSSIMNLITRSTGERAIWAPVTIVMVITSLIVALG